MFETVVDGDIVVRTDGGEYRGGILYEVEFDSPGAFAAALGATTILLDAVNQARTVSPHADCKGATTLRLVFSAFLRTFERKFTSPSAAR